MNDPKYESRLDEIQRAVENTLYQLAAHETDTLKLQMVTNISRLSELLKQMNHDGDHSEQLRRDAKKLAEFVLQLYNDFKNKQENALSRDQQALWIGSQIDSYRLRVFPYFIDRIFVASDKIYSEPALKVPEESVIWKRLNDPSFGPIDWSPKIPFVTYDTHSVPDLYQDSASNCSFVAALLSIARTKRISLLHSVTPRKNSSKYGVKLHLNGCPRTIFVDDQVPIPANAASNDSLIVRSQSQPALLWPAIIEKLYFKVSPHGYNHGGSAFHQDAYFLTGWIPTVLKLNDVHHATFSHLLEFFKKGFILLAFGTGEASTTPDGQHLPASHDYSVQDMYVNEQGEMAFVLQDPLLGSRNRKRVFTVTDWSLFESLYVNWDPVLFKYQREKSFHVITQNQRCLSSLMYCYQLKLTKKSAGPLEVRLVLEKHLSHLDSDEHRYLKIDAYKSDGEMLWSNSRHLKILKGIENPGRFHSCAVTLPADIETCTLVVSHHCENPASYYFSLKAFSNDNFTLEKAANKYGTWVQGGGEWSPTVPAGSPLYKDYVRNPQFQMSFPSPEDKQIPVNLALYCEKPWPLHLDVFIRDPHSPFEFITRYVPQNVVSGTGHPFSNTICHYWDFKVRTNTTYILVASTEKPVTRETVKFVVSLNHDNDSYHLQRIQSWLGLFSRELRFPWTDSIRYFVLVKVTKRCQMRIRVSTGATKRSDPRARLRLVLNLGSRVVALSDFDQDDVYGHFLAAFLEPGEHKLTVDKIGDNNGECVVELGLDSSFMLSQ